MLTVLLTSPRVAPGLLTWEAWSLLRSASLVTAPAGHPQLAALAAAGINVEVADAPTDGATDGATDGGPGQSSTVWLAPPGSYDVPDGAATVAGAVDLPGSHFLDLVVVMDRLRTGCPWDAKQTHVSLTPHLLEEPYEALEALENGDFDAFREELGDVLLQVVFHARIAEDFSIDDVVDGIVEKLVRRHPHVFGDVTVADAEEVKRNWDAIKRQEKNERAGVSLTEETFTSALDSVPFGQPALALAAQLQRRAGRAGVPAELMNLSARDGEGDPDGNRNGNGVGGVGVGPDLGAELFRLVARAREAGLDPELELRAAARRYRDRARTWEKSRATTQ
ncbi:MAG TPA: MazG family protein [Streptosporangiaceae bacterium]